MKSFTDIVLEEVAGNPGIAATTLLGVMHAVDHVPTHETAAEIAHLLNHGLLVMDGEKRLWPVG